MGKETVAKLKKAFAQDLTDYQSIPFWSWNNELDEEELVRQIDDMKAVGIGGFIMHARIGLKTEYLGEKWFSCIDACLRRAKELGMNAWVYDENGWPSGFVGGKLLETEEYRAQFLEYTVSSEFDECAFAVYEKTESGYARLDSPKAGVDAYHTVYLRTSPANTDILNPEVVDAFIQETHEKYYERFAESFGKELVGFFTDEPQYYRWGTPYTRAAEPVFREAGMDIRDGLIYLFVADEAGYAFRVKYFTTLNELYVTNFYKKLYDWCEEHHCKLTGHSVDEMALHSQMLGGAACMPSYEYEHIPGIDFLGRNCATELPPKQVGSVASQLGFHQVLTETYGCSGNDVTPQELKSIGEYQYFHGVSLMCQHLYPYSLAAQGKSDHPPVFSKHNNWTDGFREFNDHFTKLGYIVSNTEENYDALIIHPMRSIYLDYIRSLERASVAALETDFAELLQKYRVHGVRYHFADERILERYGKAEGDKIRIGKCVYDKVILPRMKNISASTLKLLGDYTGKLLTYGIPNYVDGERTEVELTGNYTEEELFRETGIRFESLDGRAGISSRKSALGDFIFIKNYSRTESATFRTEGVAGKYSALSLENYVLSPIADEWVLPPNESLILVKDPAAQAKARKETVEDITEAFCTAAIDENCLVLDYAEYSKNGGAFSEKLPLPHIFENLLREDFRGDVTVRQTFRVKDILPLTLMVEKSRYRFMRLNGKEIAFKQSDFDVNFQEADISSFVKEGENELLYSVEYYQHEGVHFALFDPLATESLRNCLYYDTHIENAFIKGNFVLAEDHTVKARGALPPVTDRLFACGYPFFKGTYSLEGTYFYDGLGSREIELDGRFLMAELEINGKPMSLTLNVRGDITHLLKKGENKICIRLRSSLRNMFGPLHFKPEAEPMGVSPHTFNMRGTWGEGTAPHYTHAYNSVPFGLKEIKMVSF